MNTLLHALASNAWIHLVHALLHTLWLGALITVALWVLLRRTTDPITRYRWCLAALIGLLLSGLVAWAFLQQQPMRSVQAAPAPSVHSPASLVAGDLPGKPASDLKSQTAPFFGSGPNHADRWMPRLG